MEPANHRMHHLPTNNKNTKAVHHCDQLNFELVSITNQKIDAAFAAHQLALPGAFGCKNDSRSEAFAEHQLCV